MSVSDAPRLLDYLDHILQAIQRIQRYTRDMNEQSFLSDERTQDAVVRNFEVIGEAARNIERRYPDFAKKHPEGAAKDQLPCLPARLVLFSSRRVGAPATKGDE